MVKHGRQIDCVIEEGGRLGWAIRMMINHQVFVRCQFPTFVAAVDAAEIKYGELFRAGWAPGVISVRDAPPTYDS